jgi:ACS family hexuronate transporter-like MFS transporter
LSETGRYRWYALVVTTFTQAASAAVIAAIGPLAPLLQQDFGISRAQVGLVQGAIYLSSTAFSLLGGVLADRVGERRVLMLSGAVAGIGSLAVTGVWAFAALIGVALLIGVGTGMQNPAGSAAVMRWFPPRRRGVAMGIRQTGVPLGGVLAATLAPLAAAAWGWRSAYLLAGLMALVGVGLIAVSYFDPVRPSGASAESAMSIRTLARDRRLWLIAIVYNGQIVAQYAVTVYLVLFLHEAIGLTLVAAASMLALVNVAAIAARIGWGIVSDNLFGGARRPALILVIVLTFGSMLFAAALPAGASPALVVLLALMLGAAAYAWTGLYGALTVEAVGARSAATAVAWVHVLGGLGSFGGAPFFGFVVDRTGSYRVGWLVAAGIVALGLVAALRIRERAAYSA